MATPGMPDPNATPITSDTSATGVGPAPAVPQGGQPTGVDLQALPPQATVDTAQASAPPAAPAQPGSLWKNIMMGAIQGLAGSAGSKSFGGGLATGAAGVLAQKQQAFQNQQQQAMNQSAIKFRDIQSAHMAAQLTAENQQIAHMPEQYQQQRDEHAAQMAEMFQKNGWGTYQPVDISSADGPMKYLTSQPGGASVPGHTITGANVAFVPTNADPNGQYEMYKTLGPALGFAAIDRGAWYRMTPEQQAQASRQVNNVVNGRKMDGTMYSPTELPQAVQQMQSTIDRAKKNGQPDSALQVLTAAQGELKSQLDAVHGEQDRKFEHDKQLAGIRGAAFGANRVTDWVDSDGVMHKGFAKDLPANAAPVAGSQKAATQNANFDDMVSASGNLRSAISKMEPLDSKSIALLQTAMRDGRGVTNAEIKSAGINNLSQAQKDFIVWASQLNERALALRQVAGMGQGSDSLRSAIQATLPGAGSGDKDMMLKQLGAFDNQVSILRSGVLKRPGQQTTSPGAPAAAPQPQYSHVSASGKYGWDGTKWVPIQGAQ